MRRAISINQHTGIHFFFKAVASLSLRLGSVRVLIMCSNRKVRKEWRFPSLLRAGKLLVSPSVNTSLNSNGSQVSPGGNNDFTAYKLGTATHWPVCSPSLQGFGAQRNVK